MKKKIALYKKYQAGGKVNPPIYGTKKQKQAYDDSLNTYNRAIKHGKTWTPNPEIVPSYVGKYIVGQSWSHVDHSPGVTTAFSDNKAEKEMIEYMRNKDFSYTKEIPDYFLTIDRTGPRYPIFKKPVQPIILKPEPKVNQLPIGQQYTGPQQGRIEPLQMPQPDHSNDVWMSPGTVDGVWQPAGFYSPKKEYQVGGVVPPFITSDKTLYEKRKQAYDDSDKLHKYGVEALRETYSEGEHPVFYTPGESEKRFAHSTQSVLGKMDDKGHSRFATLPHLNNPDKGEDPSMSWRSEHYIQGALYLQPKQQVVYNGQPSVVQQPLKKLPKSKSVRVQSQGLQQIQGQPQLMSPLQIPVDQSDYEWYSPEVLNGQLIHPAGFYPPLKANMDPARDKEYQSGGKISTQGYKRTSPDRGYDKLVIPSGNITMENVPHNVLGIDRVGNKAVMTPGNDYQYPAPPVTEYPMNRTQTIHGAHYNNQDMKKYKSGGNANVNDLQLAQYQLWEHGGKYNPPGMFWDGEKWVKGNANTGMQYEYGGNPTVNNLQLAQYQLWEHGGYVPSMAEYTGGEVTPWSPQFQMGGDTDEYKKGGIHIKPENKGKFTAYKKRTGKTTEEALHSPDPHVRKMANFARNAAKWKHEYGGQTMENGGYIEPETNGYYGGSPALMKFMQDGGNVEATGDTIGIYDPNIPNTEYTQPGPYRGNRGMGNPYGQLAQAGTNAVYGAIAAGNYINGMNNAQDVHKNAQAMGVTGATGWGINQPGSKGDYNPNTGRFRPESYVPTNAGYYPATMQHGGYTAGQEVELSDMEIKRLKKLGYKIQEL